MLKPVATDIAALKILDDRLRWLSAWTIHHANHVRDSADGLKVGGHQASCASMTAIMAALYFHALGENDRVRFVALIGDAELDEGNIYEALIEGTKHDVRNLWWIVDYNRQSLDATSADRMFERFDDIFA